MVRPQGPAGAPEDPVLFPGFVTGWGPPGRRRHVHPACPGADPANRPARRALRRAILHRRDGVRRAAAPRPARGRRGRARNQRPVPKENR